MLLTFAVSPVNAQYNANIQGVVTSVLVYTDNNLILVRLKNQPTTHPLCNPVYFAVGSDVDPKRIDRLLSRLLLAKTTGETVNIGYDNAGNCASGYIRLHRAG